MPLPLSSGLCQATHEIVATSELVPLAALRPPVARRVRERYPDLPPECLISREVANRARFEYVRAALEEQLGELSHLDEEVVLSLHRQEILSSRPLAGTEEDKDLPFGLRLADKIASFGGSWGFIITCACLLALWITTNVWFLASRAFDPYPFILLNLILSCVAALQAPVIMMSQNRQESRDRQQAENDYKINLKSELEIRHLHEKVDYLLHQQSTRLFEIQEIQMDLMRELTQSRPPNTDGASPAPVPAPVPHAPGQAPPETPADLTVQPDFEQLTFRLD